MINSKICNLFLNSLNVRIKVFEWILILSSSPARSALLYFRVMYSKVNFSLIKNHFSNPHRCGEACLLIFLRKRLFKSKFRSEAISTHFASFIICYKMIINRGRSTYLSTCWAGSYMLSRNFLRRAYPPTHTYTSFKSKL